MNKKTFCMTGALFLCLFVFQSGICYAVNPYDNWALARGWIFAIYPQYYTASEFKDKNGNASVSHLNAAAYLTTVRATAYTRSLLPNTVGFTVYLPMGQKILRGDRDSGIGDLTVAAGYWLIDDPGSRHYLVAGAYVDAPTGDFDKTKTVNMGSNVWKIRPAIGWAKQSDRFDVELSLFYNWYDKNKDTGIQQGSEAIFESYAGYFARPGFLAGVMFNGTFGQDKTSQGNKIPASGVRRFQAGPSLFWKASGKLSFTFNALSEFGVRNAPEGYLISGRLTWRL